jgi:bacterial/archaeal transporter family protein
VKTWVVYAALTVISWGVWGVFSKVASAHSKPRQVLIFQSVGVLAFGLVVLAVEKFNIEWSATAFSWAAAGGFLVFIGFLTFFAALDGGQASTVVVLSALYPVVTIALSILFLHERLTMKQGVGIVLALIASVLLSIE